MRIEPNMPPREYRTHPALNCSTLKAFGFAATPKAFKAIQRDESAAMRIGSAVDSELFGGNDVVLWEGTRRGAAWNDFKEANKWKIILNETEAETASKCIESLKSDPSFMAAHKSCLFQVAAFAEHPDGYEMKALVDMLPKVQNGWAFDLKTTCDAAKFEKQAYDLGYDLQAAWYMRILNLCGAKIEHFGFYIVETDAPFDIAKKYFDLDSIEIRNALERIDDFARRYVACKQADSWPGYPQEWERITLPPWAYNKR